MAPLTAGRIRHGVVFRLKHPENSDAERDFLDAIRALESIPGVEAFELAREVSRKNEFAFALSMEFADDRAYEAYNSHPDHTSFVEGRWVPEVEDFLEIDAAAL
jgi:hypothetical protein